MKLVKAVHKILKATKDNCNEISTEKIFSSELYVWPEAGELYGGDRKPLLDIMQEFLHHPEQRIHVLIGDPGAGKTTFARKWLNKFLTQSDNLDFRSYIVNEEKNDLNPVYLPIFIRLNKLLTRGKEDKAHTVFKNILEIYFQKIRIDIQNLKKSVRLLVFLDGYDEINYEGNLYHDNDWHEWPHCKFIISTRPEKFGETLARSEFENVLRKTFSTTNSVEHDPQLVITRLRDFDENDIKNFIRQWIDFKIAPNILWNHDQYWQTISSIADLKDLAVNPVILRLILFALPALQEKFANQKEEVRIHQTRLGVYQEFVNVWFQRQVGLIGQDKNILNFLKQLDLELYESLDRTAPTGLTELILNYLHRYTRNLAYQALLDGEGGKLKLELLSTTTLNQSLLYDGSQKDLIIKSLTEKQQNVLLRTLRKGCLLKCDKRYFRFFHKSIIEYFTQAHIQNSAIGLTDVILQLKAEVANDEIKKKLIDLSLNSQSIVNESNLRKFLAEQTQQDKTFEAILVEIVLLSKKYADIEIAASNAITILNQANYPINTLDLRDIRIPGADLSKATLHLSDLTDAKLDRVNFSKAYLDGANFSNASLKDCNWGTIDKIQFDNEITACIFTQDGRWLIVGDSVGNIYLINTVTWIIEKTVNQAPFIDIGFKKNHDINCLSVGYRNEAKTKTLTLASSTKSGLIYLWTIPTLSCEDKLKTYKTAEVLALVFHSIEGLLAYGRYRENIHVWNPNTGTLLRKLKNDCNSIIMRIAFHPTEALSAHVSLQHIHLYNTDTGEMIKTIAHKDQTYSLAFHPTEALLATASWSKKIFLLNTETEKKEKEMSDHSGHINTVAFHPIQKYLVSGSNDRTIIIWNIETDEVIKEDKNHHYDPIEKLVFHPTREMLIYHSKNNLYLWEANISKELMNLGKILDKNPLLFSSSISLALHPEKNVLTYAYGYDSTIYILNTQIGYSSYKFTANSHAITTLAFHPTGSLLASAYGNGTIDLWNTDDWIIFKSLQTYTKAISILAFSPNEPLLVFVSKNKNIYIWNTDTDQEHMNFVEVDNTVIAIIYHPTQILFASCFQDNTIKLWGADNLCKQIINLRHCDIGTIVFEQNGNLKIAAIKKQNIKIFTLMQNVGTETYKLNNVIDKIDLQFSARELNLTKTKGLSELEHKFLISQGAVGTPKHFAISKTEILNFKDEQDNLSIVLNLLNSLQANAGHVLEENNSLFPGHLKNKINLNFWQVSIIRVTKSALSNNNTNRHAYGLLEGMDAIGRRIWIRFDLIQNRNNKNLAWIKNLATTATSTDDISAKNAFMTLFEDSKTGTPIEIAYHVAGRINKTQMITLVNKMIDDQQRQYGPIEHHIRYRLFGGSEASTQGSHNCLTWLRAHFSAYDELKMPWHLLDYLFPNPALVIDKQTFFGSQNNIYTMDLISWANDAPEPSEIPNYRP